MTFNAAVSEVNRPSPERGRLTTANLSSVPQRAMARMGLLFLAIGLMGGAIILGSPGGNVGTYLLPLLAGVLFAAPWILSPDLRDIAGAFGVLLAAYSVPAALQSTGSPEAHRMLVLAVSVASLGYSAGRAIGRSVIKRKAVTKSVYAHSALAPQDSAAWRTTAVIGGAIALALISVYFAGFGGLNARLSAGYGASANYAAQGLGPFAMGFDLLFIVLAVGLAASQNDRRGTIVCLIGAALSALYLLRVGSRGGLLALVAAVLIAYRLTVNRPSLRRRWVVVGIFIALSGLAILGIGRYVLNTNGTVASLRYGIQHVSWSNIDPRNSPELTAPIQSLTSLVDDPSAQSLGGSSWLAAFTDVLPSGFVKPPPSPAEKFVQRYYPTTAAEGGGRGLSPIVDGYWNFGLAGVLLELLVYGVVAELVTRFIRRRLNDAARSSPLNIAFAALSWAWIFSFARIDFQTASRAVLTRLLLPLFILWFIHQIVLSRGSRKGVVASASMVT